jgi:hypothetical protein
MHEFRIFAYDPSLDDGAFFRVADLEARSENEAIERYKHQNSRAMQDDGKRIKLIARSHMDKERWPNPQTGRLPKGGL